MSQPFVGEVRMFGGTFAPVGWNFCDGTLLPISEYETLFNLIGTTYGGDGQSTFAVPDLRGRVPLHQGQGPGISQNYQLGESDGVEAVTVSMQQTPTHSHALLASAANGQQPQPTNGFLAQTNPGFPYVAQSQPYKPLNANSISSVGGSQPHENMMPFLAISFIISLFGIFPSQQ